MEIKVYHGSRAVALIKIPEGMGVDGALDYAFRWTNNINGSWSQGPELPYGDGSGQIIDNLDHNPNVTRLVDLETVNGRTYGLRSTMVGDSFEIVGGDVYRVDPFGFSLASAPGNPFF